MNGLNIVVGILTDARDGSAQDEWPCNETPEG